MAALFVVARAAPILAEKERMGPDVGGAGDQMFDPRNSGATETRQPPIVVSGREEPGDSCGGDSMHHQYPWYVEQWIGRNSEEEIQKFSLCLIVFRFLSFPAMLMSTLLKWVLLQIPPCLAWAHLLPQMLRPSLTL